MVKKKSDIAWIEFEQSANDKITQVITRSRQNRNKLKKLEKTINESEEKIRGYQNAFLEMEKQLVKLQSILYASGTTKYD